MFTLDPVSQNATFAAEAIADWNKTRDNELVLNACNQLGWHRINDSFLEGKTDPSAGPTSVRDVAAIIEPMLIQLSPGPLRAHLHRLVRLIHGRPYAACAGWLLHCLRQRRVPGFARLLVHQLDRPLGAASPQPRHSR